MKKDPKAFWEQIAREVSGNAPASQPDPLQPEPDQAAAREDAARIWAKTEAARPDYEPDVEQGWQRFRQRLETRESLRAPAATVRKMDYRSIWGIAASIALFIMVGFYFLNRATRETWTEVRTTAHETKTIRLADGSTVALNQNSTFSYPANFLKENRTVKLSGEAFFEVAKAEGKRFTIFAEGTKTEVIGTSFNLRAYAQEPVKVQVVSGKVAFARTETDDAIFLVPGQEGVLDPAAESESPSAPAIKQPIRNPNFRSWQNQTLAFSNTELESLVSQLENHYQVRILIDNEALRSCRFTTSFNQAKLKDVLEILAITGNLTITQTNGTYHISGTGCK